MTAGPPDGRLLRRGDDGYEPARAAAVWNARKPRRFPAAIVVASSEQDVAWAVRAAAAEGLRIGVRSGGHSWYGNGLRDDGMLIDLSGLTSIEIDPETLVAAVAPAVTGRTLDTALREQDLFFTVGHCGSVGLGGFALGGGYGWNSRFHGPACLNLRAIDVVLADGELIRADDTNHPELIWAARGAGPGFFGVVTRLHFDTFRRPRMARAADIYPLHRHDEVLAWALDVLPELPAELEVSVRVGYSPLAGEVALTVTGLGFATAGSDLEAVDLLAPLHDCPAIGSALHRFALPVEGMPDLHDRGADGPPIRWDVDGIWTDTPAAEIIPAAASAGLTEIPGEHSFVLWMLWGHHAERDTACWSMQAPLYLSPNAGWEDRAQDTRHERWVDASLRALAEHARGVQFSDANLPARGGTGLSATHAQHVERIRARYDPEGLFFSYLLPEGEHP